jgi:hypothetical protein
MREKLKTDRGVAGLTILLSLVVMLFVIGLLVMIFSLMGGELSNAVYTDVALTKNQTNTYLNATASTVLSTTGYINPINLRDVVIRNATTNTVISSGNYTVYPNFTIIKTTAGGNWSNVNITFTFNYGESNTATNVINETTSGISSVTDWYPIFIVIGAMVVLILLTVIIIVAIRGSGMMAGGTG